MNTKRTLLAAGISAAIWATLAGCGGKKEEPKAAAPAAAAPAKVEPLKVAFAYVGPVGDGGWTFAHDNARKAVELDNAFIAMLNPIIASSGV